MTSLIILLPVHVFEGHLSLTLVISVHPASNNPAHFAKQSFLTWKLKASIKNLIPKTIAIVLSHFHSVNYKKQLHFRRNRLYSSLTKGKSKTFERRLTYIPMAA